MLRLTPHLPLLLTSPLLPTLPSPPQALFKSTVQLVLLPTVAGLALNELFKKQVDVVRPAMPLLALALTVVLCAVPVAQVADVLRLQGAWACYPVILLHAFGYALGYAGPRLLGFNERTARTVSIETGARSELHSWGSAESLHVGLALLLRLPSAAGGWLPRPADSPPPLPSPLHATTASRHAVGGHGLCAVQQALCGRHGGGALLQ